MTSIEAFRHLVEMAESFPARLTKEQVKDRDAILIGADFIRGMSGCWHPEDRGKLLESTDHVKRLDAMLEDNG